MKVLLFLIYGARRTYHLELTYSVLSAARFLRHDPAGIRLVVMSDAGNARPDLPVETIIVSSETLRDWQMGGTYAHAAKVHAMQEALQRFHAPTVLVDSDTVMHVHPARLFDKVGPGRALMHRREGTLLDSSAWFEWKALIATSGGAVADWPIGPRSVMHNSGVVGLHSHDAALLEEVRVALGAIRSHSTMFTSEQLAFSLVLGSRLDMSGCEELVEHYWDGPREYYHYQLARLFADLPRGKTTQNLAAPLALLERNLSPPRRQRLSARIRMLGRGAEPAYRYAYTAYLSALSLRGTDDDLANVWAATALNVLTWGLSGNQPVSRTVALADFALLAPAQLHAQDWLQTELRQRWTTYWATEKYWSSDSVPQ